MTQRAVTLDEARLAAHEAALRTDAAYRRAYRRAEQSRQERAARREAMRRRRILVADGRFLALPVARLWLLGNPRVLATAMDVFEDDLLPLVCEELQPGLYAMWSDPLERLRG